MPKPLRIALYAFFGTYLLYVFGVIVVFNTPLFSWIAKMQDPTLTHVSFNGAWSIFPGRAHVDELLVAIKDSNVDIEVRIQDVEGRISLHRLFQREVSVEWATGKNATFVYYPKSGAAGAAFHAMHSGRESLKPVTNEELAKRAESNWKIVVHRVTAQVESANFADMILRGNMTVEGGFFLQPDTAAEIFPSRLTIRNGSFGPGITGVKIVGRTRFHRFWLRDSSGNKVFRFIDFDVRGEALTENFELLNLTLKSLEGYRFTKLGGNVSFVVGLREGVLQPGSKIDIGPSAIEFDTPQVTLTGRGNVGWLVGREGGKTSVLQANLGKVKGRIKSSRTAHGRITARKARGYAEIHGLDLVNPFVGLRARADLTQARVTARSTSRLKNSRWSLDAEVDGSLAAVSGLVPDRKRRHFQRPLALVARVRAAEFFLPSAPMRLNAVGELRWHMEPVDFRTGRVHFADLDLELAVSTRTLDWFQISLKTQQASRILSSPGKRNGNWRGISRLEVDEFGTLLSELKDPLQIPGVAASLLSTRRLSAEIEWEISASKAWVRAPRIRTDGAWSAWGTFMHSFDQGQPSLAIEGRIFSVFPIGITLFEGKSAFTLFPTPGWFDARR